MNVTRRAATKTLLAGAATGLTLPTRAAVAASMGDVRAAERVKTEVCVIGGGSAGTGAALAAARAGAKVVLVESESILGGTSTNAWVHTWEPTSGADGLPREIYERMKLDPLGVTYPNYALGAPRRGGQGLPFEPRVFNYVVREMLNETHNCTTLLGTTFFHARRENERIDKPTSSVRCRRANGMTLPAGWSARRDSLDTLHARTIYCIVSHGLNFDVMNLERQLMRKRSRP